MQRIIVAAIGLPLLALLLVLPERLFAAALQVILAIAVFEMMRALVPDKPLSIPISAAAATSVFVSLVRVNPDVPLWSFLAVTAAALFLILRPNSRLAVSLGGWWITACLYVGVLGAHLVLLRLELNGQSWLVVLLASTFAADTGAYAFGRTLGRHRMLPAISPNKTWEGAAGGLLTGAIAGIAAMLVLDLELEMPGMILVGLLPVAAIAGDLLESALKRRMDVKDMSGLLPGHGGFLDRLDSILLVGVSLYWIVRWLQ